MEGRMRLPLLFGFGELCLSFKQVAEFFDHQYSCMESIDTIFFFYLEIAIKGRKDLRLPVLVGCCQLCLLFNRIPGFFGHQYLWRESIKTLDFLYGDNLQQKEGPETTSFG